MVFVGQNELTEFFAELTEFAAELSEFSLPKQYSRNSILPVFHLRLLFFNLCTMVCNCARLWALGPLCKRELSSQNHDNCRHSWTIVDKYLKPPFAKPPFRLCQGDHFLPRIARKLPFASNFRSQRNRASRGLDWLAVKITATTAEVRSIWYTQTQTAASLIVALCRILLQSVVKSVRNCRGIFLV